MVSNALPFVTRLWWTFRWELNTSGLPECRFAFSSSLPPGYGPFNIVSKDSTTTLFLVIKSGKVVMLRCASCTPRNNRSISIITPIFMLKETSRQALQKPFIFSSRLSQSWCLIAFFLVLQYERLIFYDSFDQIEEMLRKSNVMMLRKSVCLISRIFRSTAVSKMFHLIFTACRCTIIQKLTVCYAPYC